MSYTIEISCPGTPGASPTALIIRKSNLVDVGSNAWVAGEAAFQAWWTGQQAMGFHCFNTERGWVAATVALQQPEVNNLDKYTPGTRPEVVKVSNSLEGAQQIANQLAAAADWGIAASILLCFFFGYYCGGRSAAPPSNSGWNQ